MDSNNNTTTIIDNNRQPQSIVNENRRNPVEPIRGGQRGVLISLSLSLSLSLSPLKRNGGEVEDGGHGRQHLGVLDELADGASLVQVFDEVLQRLQRRAHQQQQQVGCRQRHQEQRRRIPGLREKRPPPKHPKSTPEKYDSLPSGSEESVFPFARRSD